MTPAFIGIDWGTTHRRAVLVSTTGEALDERVDAEGALACAGRFRAALESLLAGWPAAQGALPVVMAGMVGSAAGWQPVPYLGRDAALSALGRHLARVLDAPAGSRWFIVPGYALRAEGRHDAAAGGAADDIAAGAIDVMRGEETQLFGALHHLGPGAADGCYLMPGTHSKWVRLRAGRVVELRTYLTGELFDLLSRHGTLASVMQAVAATPVVGAPHPDGHREGGKRATDPADPEFLRGVSDAARGPALSHALFGARARVVTGELAPSAAAAYVSGLLIGAEWADAQRLESRDEPVRVIGEPALAALHAACAVHHGRRLEVLDARTIQLAAWRALATEETGA